MNPDICSEELAERLARAGCVAPEEEAQELLAFAPDHATLQAWVSRREQGEPLAWITGRVDFFGRGLHVGVGVYVPRHQTWPLAARAASLLPDTGRAADLCTGSGAVAAYLRSKRPRAVVVGTDIDCRAAASASANGVAVVVADLDLGLRSGIFDVVTAVAPYVPSRAMRLLPRDVTRYEPRLALDGGDDGLAVVKRSVTGAARLLRQGGWLLAEIGGDQGNGITAVLATAGFASPTFWFDEDGDIRGFASQLGTAPPARNPRPPR